MKRREVLNSPQMEKVQRERKVKGRNKILLVFLCFILIFEIFVFISRIKNINVASISISGNNIVETKGIMNVVQKDLSGKYFLFPKTNIFLLSKNKIISDLHKQFPRLLDVKVYRKDLKSISIVVSERSGRYLWCGNSTDDISKKIAEESCYYLDSTGYIFDRAPSFSGDVYFTFYGSEGNIDTGNPVTQKIAERNIFENIVQFKNFLDTMKIHTFGVYIKGDGTYEMLISDGDRSYNAPKIIFNNENIIDKIASNLSSALKAEPFATEFKTKLSQLLYIDLRFNSKVVYKFTK